MPIERTKPQLTEDDTPGGLEHFKSPRVTKEVSQPERRWAREYNPRSQGTGFKKENQFDVVTGAEEVIVKVLEPGPGFYSYKRHWLGKFPFTCTGTDCPACARGDRGQNIDLFNVIVLGETPELRVWFASPDPAARLEEKALSKKGPLDSDGMYLAVSKSKGTNFDPIKLEWVREDELKDDWGLSPLTKAQIEKLASNRFDHTIVRQNTVSEIAEAARKYLDEE